MYKYTISKIDNKTYCIKNGQFSRHLKLHNLSRQEYHEKYTTGKKEICNYCDKTKKFYQKTESYANTCGSKRCSALHVYGGLTDEETVNRTAKKVEYWATLSDEGRADIRQKKKDTCLTRYGVIAPAKLQIVQDKMADTNLEKYGSIAPIGNIVVQEKRKDTLLQHYGHTHQMHDPVVCKTVSNTNISNHYSIAPTKRQLVTLYKNGNIDEVIDYYDIHISTAYRLLREHDIPLIKNKCSRFEQSIRTFLHDILACEIVYNDKTCIGKELDIYIPEKNIAIECNGSYWHAENQGRGKQYHLSKTQLCKDQGIHLIHIWHHEWNAKQELIKSRIKSKIGISDRVFARKCQVQKTDSATSKLFMNDNHIQCNCPASVRYGIYYNSDLIGVMTFGKSRYNKNIEYELLRYCTKQGINIVGGAGKLFKRFMRDYNSPSIISYSDRSWNTGSVYGAIGFEYSHSTPPSYYYTKDYTLFENRVAYQKHKLMDKLEVFDPDKTEWENMQDNKYDRIWDCGTDVYIMR